MRLAEEARSAAATSGLDSSADRRASASRAEFWPPKSTYVMSHLALSPSDLPKHLRGVAGELQSLAALLDAARVLEEAPLVDAAAGVRAVRHSAALLVEAIAAAVHSDSERDALTSRAQLLRSDRQQVDATLAARLHSRREQELFLFCGRLRTWCNKAEGGKYSALAAAPNSELNQVCDEISPSRTLELARTVLQDEALIAREAPLLLVSDIVMCAGEANRHPKHFAYFFPEDEFFSEPSAQVAVPPSDNKTVLFANLYVHRYVTSSYPRLDRFVKGLEPSRLRPGLLSRLLVTWMRGHELGHTMRYATTDLARSRAVVGDYATMCLEEALADCYGFLTIGRSRGPSLSGLSDTECAEPFIAEMLRYLGRGYGFFQDSDAALIELSFLVKCRAIRLEPGGIRVDMERLLPGVLELTQTLNSVLLGDQEQALRAFVAEFLALQGSAVRGVLPTVQAMNAKSHDLPISTTYSTWH